MIQQMLSNSAFLNIWKFLIHLLLEPTVKYFEHNYTSIQNESDYIRNLAWNVPLISPIFLRRSIVSSILLVTALSSSLGAWWTLADLGASALGVISFFLFILPKEFSRRDTGMGCHFLFYGPCFIRTLDYDLFHLQWPYTVWLLASLSCTHPFVMTKL